MSDDEEASMEQLDLAALLAKSYEICDALMRADVGSVRTEGRNLRTSSATTLRCLAPT